MSDKNKTKTQLLKELAELKDQLSTFQSVESIRFSTDLALKESEERFARMIQAAPLGVHIYRLIHDNRLIFTGANPAADEILGVDNNQFIGKTIEEAFPGLERTDIPGRYRKIAESGDAWQTEQVIYDDQKITGVYEVHAFQSSPNHMVVMFSDITDRKHSEELLKESENKYRLLVESTGQGIFTIDSKGVFQFVNGVAANKIGVDAAELIGRKIWDLFPEALAKKHMGYIKQVIALGKPLTIEEEISVFGEKQWFEGNIYPVSSDGSESQSVLYFASNISDRKKMEESLRLMQFSIDHSADAAFWITENGKLIYVNQAACQILGYKKDDLLKMYFHQLYSDKSAKEWPSVWEDIKKLNSINYESTHLKRSGENFPVEIVANYLNFEGQEYVCAFARDISEREAAKSALQESEIRLYQSQKMEAIGKLAGGVAHDFNNLLTVILSCSELGVNILPQGHQVRDYLKQIMDAGESAANLTRQLLAFSRKQVLKPRICNMNDLINDINKMLRRLIGEDISLILDLNPDLQLTKVDVGQVEQVLINLVVNARDAVQTGGKIDLFTNNIKIEEAQKLAISEIPVGDYILVTVQDNGVGMDPDVMKHVFEPFFSTKEKNKGTGLGLSTCYGIVKQNHGYIELESQLGKGSSFTIYFPSGNFNTEENNLSENILRKTVSGNETVLVVEDDLALRKLAVLILTDNGYRVFEAENGKEALEIISKENGEKIDLLFTDIVMPIMGGVELAGLVKQINQNIKILFTSGYNENKDFENLLDDKKRGYVEKPYSPPILTHKVREILDA